MTIHTSDPFATPDDAKSAVRRLRGRLPAAVTVWTAYAGDGRPAGLTVSSTLVVDGEPGRLLGLLDEESDLWAAVEQTGQFAVMPLQIADGQLADTFAGLMPAPGGPFAGREWRRTRFGPVLQATPVWAGCQLDAYRAFGWGLLVEATIVEATIVEVPRGGGPAIPLVHYRGRYGGAYPPKSGDG